MKVQNNPIATNQTNFPTMALVYDFEYGITDSVIAKIGSAAIGTPYYVEKQTARKYKLYYDEKRDDYYFKWNDLKFYTNETLRINN